MFRTVFGALIVVCCFGNRGYAGGASDSGGGDSYVIEFVATGERVSKWLSLQQINDISGLSAESFERTLKTAKITSTNSRLEIDGLEKDAINYPSEGKIVFNRSRWSSINNDFQKVGIVIHELLGLMRIDDTGYKMSIPLSSRITGTDPKSIPYFKVNYTCESLAVAFKSDGSKLYDSQKVIVGYNPSFLGMQGITHHIAGAFYYFAASISAGGGDSANPNWSVEYYWLSDVLNNDLHFQILGTSRFDSLGSNLPPQFLLPFYQTFQVDPQTKVSFSLNCRQN